MWNDTDVAIVNATRRMSFGEQLARAARIYPENVAFQQDARALSYAQLDRRVNRLASALADRGIIRGDRIAILMRNSMEMAEAYFAACKLGAIAVPVNFRLVPSEIAYILNDAEASALVVDGALGSVAVAALSEADSVRVVLSTNLTASELTAESYESVVAGASDEPPGIDVPESDAAFILYTSGTTGRPKGAVLTHLNLVMARMTLAVATGGMPDSPESTLLGVPMFHIAGLSLILGALATGGRVVMQQTAASFDAAVAVDLLEQERIAACFFVPSQWAEICMVPGIRERRFALRYVMWGAAVAPPSVLRALADTFPGVPAYCAFGQTEMSPTTCLLRAADAIIKMGSVGKPLPWIEARIVDDEMADVAPGAVGEIVYRGPTVMREYWRNEKATAEAFQGGWFHSGDLCRVDEDGFVWVMDRKKDMIISGGENIYCAEVEYAIDAHPKVAQVAVVGVAHEKWGETPVAVVVPADPGDPPTEQEIIEHCQARLASYKKPTSVVFADVLPRTASGKVQKFKLRESLR